MARKKQLKPIESLEIIDFGTDGLALGKHDNKVVFVEKLVPGDIASVQPYRQRKNYVEARAIELQRASPMRTKPFCSHFGTCGGCKWQHFDYQHQLNFKQKQVYDAFERIAKVDITMRLPIIACEELQFYRNKLEYTFSNSRWVEQHEVDSKEEITQRSALGFHIPGRFDKILDIETCYLQAEPSNGIRLFFKDFALRNDIPFYNLRSHEGNFRTLMLRSNRKGEFMVVLSLTAFDQNTINQLADELKVAFPMVTNFGVFVNTKLNDTFYDLTYQIVFGQGWFEEYLNDLSFKIGPKSFFQTNTKQCEVMYNKVIELAELQADDVVYDLYCGLGTIGCFAAKHCKQVVGIESVEEAVILANENAKKNQLEHASFFCGDMKDMLSKDFFDTHGMPNVIITDPPRAGMHADVVNQMLEVEVPKIVYVSCNPSTQARDIALLATKYEVKLVQPVDMFPHTHHAENIAVLTLRQ